MYWTVTTCQAPSRKPLHSFTGFSSYPKEEIFTTAFYRWGNGSLGGPSNFLTWQDWGVMAWEVKPSRGLMLQEANNCNGGKRPDLDHLQGFPPRLAPPPNPQASGCPGALQPPCPTGLPTPAPCELATPQEDTRLPPSAQCIPEPTPHLPGFPQESPPLSSMVQEEAFLGPITAGDHLTIWQWPGSLSLGVCVREKERVCVLCVRRSLGTALCRGWLGSPLPPLPNLGVQHFLPSCRELQAASMVGFLTAVIQLHGRSVDSGDRVPDTEPGWTLRCPKHPSSYSWCGPPFFRLALVSSSGFLRRGCE